MECKIVVGIKSGKSFNLEAKDDLAAVFLGKRIGDIVNVTPLGLKGYEVKITGGSDKQGFPMRKDAHIMGRTKALLTTRTAGYRPEKLSDGMRLRKTIVGDIINDAIAQINTIVVKEGHDSIEKLLGIEKPAEGAPAEGAAKPEAAAHKPEEKKEHKEAREGREATLRTGSPEANLVPKEHKPEHKPETHQEHKAEAPKA